MKMSLFAIRDVKVERFYKPFPAQNQLDAQRTFLDLCRVDPNVPYDQRRLQQQHPEDYTLYEIGTFDDESGELTNIVARVVLIGSEAANAA